MRWGSHKSALSSPVSLYCVETYCLMSWSEAAIQVSLIIFEPVLFPFCKHSDVEVMAEQQLGN
jgi:hypothetical protein